MARCVLFNLSRCFADLASKQPISFTYISHVMPSPTLTCTAGRRAVIRTKASIQIVELLLVRIDVSNSPS